jgi:hypothetical protein
MGFSGLVVVFSIIGQIYDIDQKVNSICQQKMALNRASEVIGIYNSRAIAAAPGSRVAFKAINFSGHYKGGYVRESTKIHRNPGAGMAPAGAAAGSPGMQITIPVPPGSPPGTLPTTQWVPCMVAPGAGGAPLAGSAIAIDEMYDDIDSEYAYAFSLSYASKQPDGSIRDELLPPDQAGLAELQTAGKATSGRTMGPGEVLMKKEEAEARYKAYLAKISGMEKELDMQLESLRSKRQALVSQKEEFQKYVAEGIKMTFKNAYA